MNDMSWQPIDTAPKDGTRFLFSNDHIIGIGFYINNWFATDSWGGSTNTCPTHWMPLPLTPSGRDSFSVTKFNPRDSVESRIKSKIS